MQWPTFTAPVARQDLSLDLLLQAMRRGRANILQGEQGFTQGVGQDLSALFARQGMGGSQPGLTAALAEQGRLRGQEQEMASRRFGRGLSQMETASALEQVGEMESTRQTLAMQNLQGRIAERTLRNTIVRMRESQKRSNLLNMLGELVGLGTTALIV